MFVGVSVHKCNNKAKDSSSNIPNSFQRKATRLGPNGEFQDLTLGGSCNKGYTLDEKSVFSANSIS